MKQELKEILKQEINHYQHIREILISEIQYHDEYCDLEKKDNMVSAYHFDELNNAKTKLRKVVLKLKKLREIQKFLKNVAIFDYNKDEEMGFIHA